jgi:hypothetical protein
LGGVVCAAGAGADVAGFCGSARATPQAASAQTSAARQRERAIMSVSFREEATADRFDPPSPNQ